MTTSLKSLYSGVGGDWALGESRLVPIGVPSGTPAIVVHEGKTLVHRATAQTILASDYPEFYSKFNGFSDYTSTFWQNRNTGSGQPVIYAEGAGNRVIVVSGSGSNYKIHSSANGGVSFTEVQLSAVQLGIILRFESLNKWIVPINSSSAYVSTDGVSFSIVPLTGLNDFTMSMLASNKLRYGVIGNHMVMASITKVWTSLNGVDWADITATTGGIGGLLTFGNGYAVILKYAQPSRTYYTTDGSTWLTSNELTDVSFDEATTYGVVFRENRWWVSRTTVTLESYGSDGGNGYLASEGIPAGATSPSYSWSSPYRSSSAVPSSFSYTVHVTGGGSGGGLYLNSGRYWWDTFRPRNRIGRPTDYGVPISSDSSTTISNTANALQRLYDNVQDTGNTAAVALSSTITQSGQMWKPGQVTGYIEITGNGSVPALTLPAKAASGNTLHFEGIMLTRIK